MENRIDLHVHSTASDGVLTPKELIDLAVAKNLCALALTDHDTVDGIPEALEYAEKVELTMIPGVEFSVDYPAGTMHIIGLYIDHTNRELVAVLKELKALRESRAGRIFEDLKKNGIIIPFEEVIEESGGSAIGKPHFGRVLIRHGYADSMDQVFQRYMSDGKPGDVLKEKIVPGKALQLIRDSGGISVLAHPVSLECSDYGEFEKELNKLTSMGLEGIEAYASMHNSEQVDAYREIGRKHGLVITGGSDFHGDHREELGLWCESCPIPCSLLDDLEAYVRKREF